MTNKTYLKQIKILNAKITYKENQLKELESRIMQAGGANYSHDRVQSTPKHDRLTDDIIRMIDLKDRISTERAEYFEKKQEIVNRIYLLEDSRYIDILVKRYVEFKRWEDIADEMHYSMDRVFQLHREALQLITVPNVL